MSDEEKLELLARLLPYVSDDDVNLDMEDFSRVIADRVSEDLNGT